MKSMCATTYDNSAFMAACGLGQMTKSHHVSKCTSYNQATMVITWRANEIHDFVSSKHLLS